MKSRPHTHPCAFDGKGCTNHVPCSGTLTRNHDGHPPVTCDLYHSCSGEIDAPPCESCQDDTCVLCERVVKLVGHDPKCSQHPDNIEGPDPLWDVAMPYARNH